MIPWQRAGFLVVAIFLTAACSSGGGNVDQGDATGQTDSMADVVGDDLQGVDGRVDPDAVGDLADTSLDADLPDADVVTPPDGTDAEGEVETDTDVQCTPQCDGLECGDDGCGGSCGECGELELCLEGICTCVPDCDGIECGDDGCGGSCGDCDESSVCVEGVCQCNPQCDGIACGDDGCGGSCGECEFGTCVEGSCFCEPSCGEATCGDDGCGGQCGTCNGQDLCVEGKCVCQAACDGKVCGDDGCGGFCGHCEGQDACIGGTCVCQPACDGKQCGPDGCGGSCGNCMGLDQCVEGHCQCVPMCDGVDCGDDGCGGSCGTCTGFDYCQGGVCVCQPNCLGKQCGSDGCGGSCGDCQEPYTCIGGACYCQPNCDGKVCGSDGCGGSCGSCGQGEICSAAGVCDCVPQCQNKMCGADNCGGVCGECGTFESCNAIGQCICAFLLCGDACCPDGDLCVEEACCSPSCDGVECGDDGCGGSCGSCPAQNECQSGLCVCIPDCDGKVCGDDGCGGSCGNCVEPDACEQGICVCQPACDGLTCGPDGCGDKCGICSTGLVCTDGQVCLADPMPDEYFFGVNYDSISDDESNGFLGVYDDSGVRTLVQTQLNAMAQEGVRLVITRVRLSAAEGATPTDNGAFNVPPTAQQLANLADYASDVVGTSSGGDHLRLVLAVEYEGCANYHVGTPATTLGECEWTAAQWQENVYASWVSLATELSTVYRADGRPAVTLWYIDTNVRVAMSEADPAKQTESKNQRWFLSTHYEALRDQVQELGQNASLTFLLAPDDEMASNRQFIDYTVPPVSGHGSMYWLYRSLLFLMQNGITRPERLDIAFYPSYEMQYGNMATLVNQTMADLEMLLPSVPQGPDTYAFVETWYPGDATTRRTFGAILDAEHTEFPNLQFVCVRPVPVPVDGTSPGAPPWSLDDYSAPGTVEPFATHNGSFEVDLDESGLADLWEPHWRSGNVSPWSVGVNSSTTQAKDGTRYLHFQVGVCGDCTEPTDGVWLESDPTPVYVDDIVYVRFYERNDVTPWGAKPPADDYRGVVAELIAVDSVDADLAVLDIIGATYGLSQWHEHALIGVVPPGTARVKVRFGLQQSWNRAVDFDWVR